MLAALDGRAAEDGRTRAAMGERLLAEALDHDPRRRMPRKTNGKIDTRQAAESLLAPTGPGIAKIVRELDEAERHQVAAEPALPSGIAEIPAAPRGSKCSLHGLPKCSKTVACKLETGVPV